MTLEQARWSVFEVLARFATRGINAQVTGIYSISPQSDGTANVYFDLHPPDCIHNGMEGLLLVPIDQDELMRTEGPEQLLEYIRGGLQTRH